MIHIHAFLFGDKFNFTALQQILRQTFGLSPEKPDLCICENKGADQLCGNCAAFVFATQIV